MTNRLPFLAIAFLLVAGPGWIPFDMNGVTLTWKTDTVPMHAILPSPGGVGGLGDAAAFAAVERAMDRWNSIPCDHARLELAEPMDTIGGIGVEDATNRIGFLPDLFGDSDEYIIAVAVLFIEEGPKRIVETDVFFNTRHQTFTTTDDACAAEVDVEGIAFHELGHVLGLDHTSYPEGSMYPYYTCGTLGQRTPSRDDAKGVCAIYGSTLPQDWDPIPGGGPDPLEPACPTNEKCYGRVFEDGDRSFFDAVPSYKRPYARNACGAGDAPGGAGTAAAIAVALALWGAARVPRTRRQGP